MQTENPDPNEIIKISSTFIDNEMPISY